MDPIQQMHSSVSIVDVVSRYRPLVKAGKNFKAMCPFHDDHDPSLVVNPDQNFAWCFACQNGGDIFAFVQKIEGVSFPEAVKIVGEIGGVDTSFLSQKDPAQQKKERDHAQTLRDILLESQRFFQAEYAKNTEAQNYAMQRNLSLDTQKKFGIGYAPNSFHQLKNILLEKGYSRKAMQEAGIVKPDEKNGEEVIVRFRNRLMFPVKDSFGNICGFAGRAMGDTEPKYLNSPETALYDKSKNLFGFFEAKQAIRNENMAILVEGNVDVMACHQAGIENAIAISGVGFSENQASLLKRFCTRVSLALDGDKAGKEAAYRILPTLLQSGFAVFLVRIPEGKDPDDAIRANLESFQQAIQGGENAISALVADWARENPPSSAQNKRIIFTKLFPLIDAIPRTLEQKEALENASSLLSVDMAIIQDEFQEFIAQKNKYTTQKMDPKKTSKTAISQNMYFWGMMIRYTSECEKIFTIFDASFFLAEEEKKLYALLQNAYSTSASFSLQENSNGLSTQMREEILKSILFAEQLLSNLPPAKRKEEINNTAFLVGKILLTNRIKEAQKKLSLSATPENTKAFQHCVQELQRFHSSF